MPSRAESLLFKRPSPIALYANGPYLESEAMSLTAFRNLRSQWFPPTPSFIEKDVPPQNGRVFIVTGGNTGVGYELCKLLYSSGAKIYMTSRSKVDSKEK